jgi:hypothetical protein
MNKAGQSTLLFRISSTALFFILSGIATTASFG